MHSSRSNFFRSRSRAHCWKGSPRCERLAFATWQGKLAFHAAKGSPRCERLAFATLQGKLAPLREGGTPLRTRIASSRRRKQWGKRCLTLSGPSSTRPTRCATKQCLIVNVEGFPNVDGKDEVTSAPTKQSGSSASNDEVLRNVGEARPP